MVAKGEVLATKFDLVAKSEFWPTKVIFGRQKWDFPRPNGILVAKSGVFGDQKNLVAKILFFATKFVLVAKNVIFGDQNIIWSPKVFFLVANKKGIKIRRGSVGG